MTDPGDAPHVVFDGPASAIAAAVAILAEWDFCMVGGLAVMVRVGGEHRATTDLDAVFDNDTDVPTTASLVRAGVAVDATAIQRVTVGGVNLDVIDTFALPENTDALPENPKDRLFVTAHRWAYETATTCRLSSNRIPFEARVASAAALVATKAHALRWATANRRATKRTSDLYDLYRLAELPATNVIDPLRLAPWELASQVAGALSEDLADLGQAAALLRSSPSPNIAALDPNDFIDVVGDLIEALGSPPDHER